MSSAAQPVEIIPDHREKRSGLLRKPFTFSPGILFTFSPESCSPSPRNVFHVPAGIAFTLPRNPHLLEVLQPKKSEQRGSPNQTGDGNILADTPEQMPAARGIAALKRQFQAEPTTATVDRSDAAKPLRLPDEKV